MADPRSSFRFRMPRLRPSVPTPRSITRTTTRRPSTPPEPPTPIIPQGVPPPPTTTTTTTIPPPSPPIPPQSVQPPPTPATQPILPPLPIAPTQLPPPPIAPKTAPMQLPPPPIVPKPTSAQLPPAPPPPNVPKPAPAQLPPPPNVPKPAPAQLPLLTTTTIAPAPFVLPPPPPPQDEPMPPPPPPQPAPPSPVVSSFTNPPTNKDLQKDWNVPTSTKSPEPTKPESQPSSPSQSSIRSRLSSKPPSPSRISANPPLPSTTVQPPFPTEPHASPSKITPKLQTKSSSSSSSSSRPVSDIASDNSTSESDAINEGIEAPKVEEKKQKDAINTPESPQISKPINESETSTHVNRNDTNARNQFSNEKPLNVITFAGDNRGTSMRINGGIKRERKIYIHRKYKIENPDEISETTTDEDREEISNNNGKKLEEKDSESVGDLDQNAYINCNIQGINNSMVLNSSLAERNPGVHLGRNNNNPKNVNKKKKSKINATDMANSSRKVTTIRRRCLRGLFMESSDSDEDDREKARRHGCRYTAGEKNKKEKMDVV